MADKNKVTKREVVESMLESLKHKVLETETLAMAIAGNEESLWENLAGDRDTNEDAAASLLYFCRELKAKIKVLELS
jgi:hypothetical protein